MSDPAIAALIREVLAEELQKLGAGKKRAAKGSQVREEHVTVNSDRDLADLVAKILKYAADSKTRSDIEQGRLVFRLSGSKETTSAVTEEPHPTSNSDGGSVTVSSGFFSERQVDQLPKGTKTVRFGRSVRLTPLARDRLRHRGISIERTEG